MRPTPSQVHASAARAVRPAEAVRAILGLGLCALAAWLAFAAVRADALSDLTAHAGWCISGGEGAAPSAVSTFLGHCALCWESAAAAFAGAALLAAGGQR